MNINDDSDQFRDFYTDDSIVSELRDLHFQVNQSPRGIAVKEITSVISADATSWQRYVRYSNDTQTKFAIILLHEILLSAQEIERGNTGLFIVDQFALIYLGGLQARSGDICNGDIDVAYFTDARPAIQSQNANKISKIELPARLN